MTEQNSHPSFVQHRFRLDGWSIGAIAIAAVVLAPMVAVVWIAFHPTENIWPHLLSSVLPRYFGNTLILMAGVGLLTAMVGTGAAWLVAMYRFPGSRWLDYALLFPLAIPAYVGAYALVDFLDYSGPMQIALRAAFGWTSARDYWFPEVRAHGPAIIVLAAALYPYVYLLARAAFREQSGSSYEVARALGAGPWGLFFRVGLPLARPAIATGVALALMETVADYGTVVHFGVQTLTTGVFSTWLNGNNAGGAAQIAGVILTLILLLVALERVSRRNARFHRPSRSSRPLETAVLTGPAGWIATALCVLPFVIGFVLPVGVMLGHAIAKPSVWLAPGLLEAALNTLLAGGLAAGVTVGAALFLVYGVRMAGRGVSRLVLPLTTLGYAAPGAVLAVGLLIPLAALDNAVADAVLAVTGYEPGLLMTGTAGAIVLAYAVRFFGIAQGAVDAAFGRVS
ncbi:MAG: iron ABC transporter permease, partial [Pseudomonadota bacterium]